MNLIDEVKNLDIFRKVVEKCVESVYDYEFYVEKFSLKFDVNKNVDKCILGEKFFISELNFINEKILNLSNGMGMGLDLLSLDILN